MANKWLTTAAIAFGVVALPSVAAAENTWRFFGGITNVDDVDYDYGPYTAEVSVDSGFVIGGALGMNSGNWTFEGELAHRSADLDQLSVGPYHIDVDGDVSATSLMANAWYNFPTGGSWGFYAGGGAGFAQADVEIEGYSDDSTEFAWQLGAGINMRTQSGFAWGVGYRYFNISEIGDTDVDVQSHDFIFEISSSF